MRALSLILASALAASPALADPIDTVIGIAKKQLLTQQWVNLRVGATGPVGGAGPTMCGEVAPLVVVSVEMCGNGSGFLHDRGVGEMAHFRGKLRVPHVEVAPRLKLSPQVGLGFAELEVGPGDTSGFQFLAPTTAQATSVAGPEASASLQVTYDLFFGFEAIASATVGAGYFPYAERLVVPHAPVQPFASFELGVGF